MVELLVTIIIAAIFFAALVPVFVMASRQNSIDRTRTVAMNIAQSRVEAIRSLPYDLVTTGTPTVEGMNLIQREDDSSDSRDMRFDGPWKSGDRSAKVYRVAYAVTDSPNGQDYKFVTVTVTWDGAPTTGKPVILRTAVYRRPYSTGAVGLKIFTDQDPTPQEVNGLPVFDTTPVKGQVTVDPLYAANVSHVSFFVTANNGADSIADGSVDNYAEDDLRFPLLSYVWPWEGSTDAPDGDYTFSAVAVMKDGTSQMWQKHLTLDCGKNPDPPQWAAVPYAGAAAIMVTWSPTSAGDLRNYVVERQRVVDTDGTSSVYFNDLPPWSTTLIDRRSLATGVAYKYRVMAYDESGNPSTWSLWTNEVPDTQPVMLAGSSSEPPNMVASVGAQQVSAIVNGAETWQKRVDVTWLATTGATGVSYYFVYRSRLDDATYSDTGTGRSSPLYVVQASASKTSYSWDDASVEWRGLYTYSISAADSALDESARVESPSVSVLLTTGQYNLTVTPKALSSINTKQWYALFSFVSLDTGDVYPKPWGISQPNPKVWVGTKSYTQMLDVFGRYKVTVYYYSSQSFVGSMSTIVDLADQRLVTFTWTGQP